MLVELEIENLALVSRLRIPFTDGLVALTGETGAGKTLVLRAIELLLGDRAERHEVRTGAEHCRVAALVRVPNRLRATLAPLLEPAALDDDGELVLSRTIAADGKSRCHANGRLVPLGTLKAAGSKLFERVGQNEALALEAPAERARLLDAFGGTSEPRRIYAEALAHARSVAQEAARLATSTAERQRRLDFLRYQRDEIAAVDVKPGELAELERKMAILDRAQAISTLTQEAIFALNDADGSIVEQLGRFAHRAHEVADAGLLEPARAALERALTELDDAIAAFRAAANSADLDPREAEGVERRLSDVRRLLDRHGGDEATLEARRDEITRELDEVEHADQRLEGIQNELANADAALAQAGEALRSARERCGKKLAEAVRARLRELGMEQARFSVRQTAHEGKTALERARPHGLATVEFMLAANPGHDEQPLAQVASGGENARIALALQSALGQALDVPVLVFDEIESGIGARLGDALGAVLRRLAEGRQVLVVTHLAPVAAFARSHLRVAKRVVKGVGETHVETLDATEREAELAAMMRGRTASDVTRKEARQLLDRASGADP